MDNKPWTLIVFCLTTFTASLLAQNKPFSASVELIRDFALTADEQPIENTIAIETDRASVTFGIENIYYGSASTPSATSDEINLYAGIALGEHITTTLLQRLFLEDTGELNTNLSGGGIVSLGFESFINITDDNEFTVTYTDPTWEYLNTLLLEYPLYESGALSAGLGVENELILAKDSDAVNGTLFFVSVGYESVALTGGYIIEAAPEVAHSLEFGLTFEL
ncbi:MAG: hypothetical protein OCC49_08755 [Fibrobacterales bacterium]